MNTSWQTVEERVKVVKTEKQKVFKRIEDYGLYVKGVLKLSNAGHSEKNLKIAGPQLLPDSPILM